MIVITGLGAVTSLGATAGETWERVARGDRGLSELSLFPSDGYRVRLVAEVPGVSRVGPSEDVSPVGDFSGSSRTSELAMHAAREALVSAELSDDGRRIGLVVGGSTAGMLETESLLPVIFGPEGIVDPKVRDEALGKMLSHPLSAPADRLARELGPFARVRSLSSACSSGANAMLVGAIWIELGLCDVVLCGAADALCRVTVAGFNALGSLDPEGARPFDRRRRGLTLGEGAGFVVLERAEDAMRRGKHAVCTLLGWASRAEAHHITNPEPTGSTPARAMEAALARAGLDPADIDYVNAHGTGTPLNDPMESRAYARVLGRHVERVAVSSQKGQIGHTLAASGAIEAAITAMAIAKGVVPPTGGLEDPDPECALAHVRKAERREIRAALTSSFGFGGMDTVLVLGRPDARPAARAASAHAPRRARRVVVTGASAITPAGIFEGKRVADLLTLTDAREALTVDLGEHLDVERARRLDRAARIAAVACDRAIGKVASAGIVLGNAFGSVEGTSAFMRRLQQKGPRFASPADFPSLVPSSPAGHVSIYLGLTGPTLVVADLRASGECAVTQAFELVAAGEVDRVVAVAVEESSPIVDAVFRVIFGADRGDGRADRPPRREGAGAVALAAEETARADGLPIFAHFEQALVWTDAEALTTLAPPPSAEGDAIVVLGSESASIDRVLDRSSWAGCERLSCARSCGSHEAAGGIGVAVAASILGGGDGGEGGGSPSAALCIGSARGSGYALLLRKWTT